MKKKLLILANIILFILISGCTKSQTDLLPDGDGNEVTESLFIYSDTSVVTGVNTSSSLITFQNLETGLRYTLSYDNLTFFTDSYDKGMVVSEVKPGMICNISFDREGKMLQSLTVSGDFYSRSNVDAFKFYNKGTRMEYLGDKYEIDENVVIMSGSSEIRVEEIAEDDIITVNGKDHRIYSIMLEKGHGYVRLENDDYFLDGYIEIGKDIRKITEDMMVMVPEGNYDILISNRGTTGVKNVTVGRNQEVTLDLSDIEIKIDYSMVSISVEPEGAKVFIDGEKVTSIDTPVKLQYGIHEIIIRADGYETLSRYISVGSPTADVSFKLDKMDEDLDEKESKNSQSTSSGDTSSDTSSEGNSGTTEGQTENTAGAKIYIDAPANAEVYVDGNYVGIAPTSFLKKGQSMVITLRKAGCQTRSYTINIDDLENDSHYSFSDLLELEESE